MKTSRWPLCFAVLAALAPLTCGPTSQFDVPEPSQATVTSSSSTTSLTFAEFTPFNIAKSPVVSEQALNVKQFDSVTLSTFTLTGQGATTLEFIKDIKFYIQGTGQDRVIIAHGGPFEAGNNVAYLAIDENLNLAPQFKGTSVSITNEVTMTLPGNPAVVEAEPTFTVHVSQLPSACVR